MARGVVGTQTLATSEPHCYGMNAMKLSELDYLSKCERDGTRASRQQITDKAFELLHIALNLREELETLRRMQRRS